MKWAISPERYLSQGQSAQGKSSGRAKTSKLFREVAAISAKNWTKELVERWPTWFNTGGDIKHTLLPRGFTHADGWFDILWPLCGDLEPLVTEMERAGGRQFEVLQVKENFGGLRIHMNYANDAIRQRILAAIQESIHTCEVCGQSGALLEGDWIKTLCDEHANARGARIG